MLQALMRRSALRLPPSVVQHHQRCHFTSEAAVDGHVFGEVPVSRDALGDPFGAGNGSGSSGGGGREPNNLRHAFHDTGRHRCRLCDEAVSSYAAHVGTVHHTARSALYQRLLTGKLGHPVDGAVKRLWRNITADSPVDFARLDFLSSAEPRERRRRAVWLLKVLFEFGILRETFSLMKTSNRAGLRNLHRTTEFERNEMIGDNVLKFTISDRLLTMFPASQGGLSGALHNLQPTIDSNDGLLRCYDYFRFDEIIGAALANSKFKADVVESLFGELQVHLWATELAWGSAEFGLVVTEEQRALRALVEHVSNELVHVMLAWQAEFVVRNMRDALLANFKPSSAQYDAAVAEALRAMLLERPHRHVVVPVLLAAAFPRPGSPRQAPAPARVRVAPPCDLSHAPEQLPAHVRRVGPQLHPQRTAAVYRAVSPEWWAQQQGEGDAPPYTVPPPSAIVPVDWPTKIAALAAAVQGRAPLESRTTGGDTSPPLPPPPPLAREAGKCAAADGGPVHLTDGLFRPLSAA